MRLIIIILIAYILYRFLKGLFALQERPQYRPQPLQPRPTAGSEELVEDTHCHTYVPLSNAYRASVKGKIFYFCSSKCLDEFTANQKKGTRTEAP